LPARGTGAAVEGHLMREGQRPRASHLARVSETLTVALCLLGLAAPAASAADSSLAPDRSAPPFAPAGSETPRPDPAPEATAPSGPLRETRHVTRSINPPVSVTRVPSGNPEGAAAPPRTQLSSSSSKRAPRAHAARAAERTPSSRTRVAHMQVPPSISGSAVVSLAPSRADGALMLLAAFACMLLMLASLTLRRLLRSIGGTPHEGHVS
jgi:hypothetical protein